MSLKYSHISLFFLCGRHIRRGLSLVCILVCLFIFEGCKADSKKSDLEAYNEAAALYEAKDYEKAYAYFSKLAEQGNPAAQAFLGILYANGLGVKKSIPKAIHWYEISAEAGVPTSMVALGDMYRKGVSVERNCGKALYWYEKAVEFKYSMGMYVLAHLYRGGGDV